MISHTCARGGGGLAAKRWRPPPRGLSPSAVPVQPTMSGNRPRDAGAKSAHHPRANPCGGQQFREGRIGGASPGLPRPFVLRRAQVTGEPRPKPKFCPAPQVSSWSGMPRLSSSALRALAGVLFGVAAPHATRCPSSLDSDARDRRYALALSKITRRPVGSFASKRSVQPWRSATSRAIASPSPVPVG